MTDALTPVFYQYFLSKGKIEDDERMVGLRRAFERAVYWEEMIQGGISIRPDDLSKTDLACLKGLWRGRGQWEREQMEKE